MHISNVPNIRKYIRVFNSFTRQTWLGIAFIIPATLVGIGLLLYPTIQGIWLAFLEKSLLSPTEATFVGSQNFITLFNDPEFWNAFKHSVLLTTVVVILEYVFGLALALVLKQRVPGIQFFRSVSMVTWAMPIIVMTIIFEWMVHPNVGFINAILSYFSLPTKNWLGSQIWAFPIIVIMFVWRNIPFYAIALLAGMVSIPESQYEAASLDGATSLRKFRYITLPQISHVSMIMIVLHVITTFNNFQVIFLSTGGGPLSKTEVLPTFIYKKAFASYALGYAASAGLIMLGILLIFTYVYVKLEDID